MGHTLKLKLSEFRHNFNKLSEQNKIQAFMKKPSKQRLFEGESFISIVDTAAIVIGIVLRDELISTDILLTPASTSPGTERNKLLLKQFLQCCSPKGAEIADGLNLEQLDLSSTELDAYFEIDDYIFKLAQRNQQIVLGCFNKNNPGAEGLKSKQYSAFLPD
ncbi:MAG TPA: hypothetical protein V6C86_04680 [Oculatellaceae cyanobacterium]